MDRKRNHDIPLSEDMKPGEAILWLLGGYCWMVRTVFWGFMVLTFAPIMGSIMPPEAAQNVLVSCVRNGIRLLEEARDKGYITEECYEANKNNFS